MKKLLCLVISIAIFASVIFSFSTNAFASSSGERLEGTNTYYSYNSGVLTISGTGAMPNYSLSNETIPWYDYRDVINKVVIEEGVTTVGSYCFYYCGASEYALPSTLRTIGDNSIANNQNLVSIDIPFGTKTIGQYAFFNCTKLKNVSLPLSVTTIGARAFQSCGSITDIVIPYSVTNIGMYAFNICTKLSSITFQSSTAPITFGANVFTGCSALKEIVIPLNSSCGTRFFGYMSTSSKVSGTTMYVYENSNADRYAKSNNIAVSYLDTIPVECGVDYVNIYNDDNVSTEYHYTFTAGSSEEFCFYTTGEVDLKASLYHNGKMIAQNDDISSANTNFSITTNCTKGEVYDLFISSSKAKGRYSLVVLPTAIDSFNISGAYTISASDGVRTEDGTYFTMADDMLNGALFTVNYTNGLMHRFYYSGSYYDGKNIAFKNQREYELNCGKNDVSVMIGDKVGAMCINIEHSYTESIVQPTPDEDGYTLHSCVNCDDSFKDNFFPTDKKIYTLSGKCVLSEDKYGYHEYDLPYPCATISVGNRKYNTSEDGTWCIKTFNSCEVVFNNPYGMNYTINYIVDDNNPDAEYGMVALDGYDFNADGYVNAKDFAIYKREKKDSLCNDYWRFAENFIRTH